MERKNRANRVQLVMVVVVVGLKDTKQLRLYSDQMSKTSEHEQRKKQKNEGKK